MPLFVVATPIGNLDDMTIRARDTLMRVDCILCEDTRVTRKLLARYDIIRPLRAFHQHSSEKIMTDIVSLLHGGAAIALVTDAGTPGVSDPGNKLINRIVRDYGDTIPIIPIPGASALTALISVAGMPMDRFVFLGFLPHKKGRTKLIKSIADSHVPVIVYESPHRIIRLLDECARLFPEGTTVVGKELTKMFEKIYRGTPPEVCRAIRADGARGEYTVILFPAHTKNAS